MNLTIVRKAFVDSMCLLIASCAVIILFEVLLANALATLAPELIRLWSSIKFLQGLFKFTFHMDLAGDVSPVMLLGIGIAHPFLFAVSWGHFITFCTRIPVGEVDRGTADMLLGLPVSRSSIYLSNSLVCLCQLIPVTAAVWLGLWIGYQTVDLGAPFPKGRFVSATVNYGVLLLAICGVTYCASSFFNRRSVVIGIVLCLLLSSFLINVMEAFLPIVRKVGFLGLLSYHKPVEPIRDGAVSLRDLTVLGTIGVSTWLIGWWQFVRRDIPAA